MYFTDAVCGYYKFDVHKTNEEMVHAELRLLQKKLSTLDSHYNVHVYYLLDDSSHQSSLKLSFKNIDPTPGWKTFNITPIALKWKQGLVNHGIQLKLTKDGEAVSCEGIFAEGEQDPINTEPLLILFTNDYESEFFKHILKEERKSLKKNHVTTEQQRRKHRAVKVQNAECHLKEMIVTAESLSFGNLHVQIPKRFNAGVCSGHCKKLQPSLHTDHANILSLYYRNTLDISVIPSRCCVPTKFKKINMLFYNEKNRESIYKPNVPVQATECNCL